MQILSAQVVLPISDDPLFEGGVAIEGSTIVAVGPAKALQTRFPEAQHRHLEGSCLLPGLVNAHTHLDLTLFPTDEISQQPGGAPAMASGEGPILGKAGVDFISWIQRVIEYRKSVIDQTLADAIVEGLDRCLRSGTTCVGEISKLEGEFALVENAGIRAALFPELISFDSENAFEFFETAIGMLDKYGVAPVKDDAPAKTSHVHDDLITVGLSPHAPYTVSKPLLKIIRQYALEANCRVQIHAAESFHEMEFFFDAGGDIAQVLFPYVGWKDLKPPCVRKTPIEYLDSIGFLDCRPALVHCVQLSDDDFTRLIARGCQVILCPRSNVFLGHGLAPIKKLFARGIPMALGTDSMASNCSLSLWDEMRFLKDYLALKKEDSSSFGAQEILAMATLGGARALGLERQIGSLEKGKAADLVAVRLKEEPMALDAIYDQLIDQTHDVDIGLVMVNGRVLIEKGKDTPAKNPSLPGISPAARTAAQSKFDS